MPLFVFDHDYMDRSVHMCIQDGAAVMSAPVVAMGHFCWPWPGAVGGAAWVGTSGKVRRNKASLWTYSLQWRDGVVQAGVADGAATASFHDHR